MTVQVSSESKPFRRLLLTGAAGNLGCQLRHALKNWADIVRLTDVVPIADAQPHEEVEICDLADEAAVLSLMDGVDAVVHFGGISVEAPFADLLEANIRGVYNLYSAAHRKGVHRIVYASSNHATGFYPTDTVIGVDVPLRPDCLYGVTKCFGEILARYYFDRFGLESVCVRIGSSFPEPQNRRMLTTYLSYRDLIELVRCSLFTSKVGCTAIYGVSNNSATWWDNTKANHLGYRPQDSSAAYEDRFPVSAPTGKDGDPALRVQGGPFALKVPMEKALGRRTAKVERLETSGNDRAHVGECPVWRAKEHALYSVDIPRRAIIRNDIAASRRREWILPEQVGSIAFDQCGTVLAAMESGLFAVKLGEDDSVSLKCVSPVAHAAKQMRFNDGRCDRQGRFWAGTMQMGVQASAAIGNLYRFNTDLCLSDPIVSALIVQNGLSWSPDGKIMYLSDSHGSRRTIWKFDYDCDEGRPHDRRIFADLHDYEGRPDGAAVDADGCYWTCANDAGRLLRFTPEGKLDRSILLPAKKPSMCAFGDHGLTTLFITTIRPDDGSSNEHDGHIYTLHPGVSGLPEPEFGGRL